MEMYAIPSLFSKDLTGNLKDNLTISEDNVKAGSDQDSPFSPRFRVIAKSDPGIPVMVDSELSLNVENRCASKKRKTSKEWRTEEEECGIQSPEKEFGERRTTRSRCPGRNQHKSADVCRGAGLEEEMHDAGRNGEMENSTNNPSCERPAFISGQWEGSSISGLRKQTTPPRPTSGVSHDLLLQQQMASPTTKRAKARAERTAMTPGNMHTKLRPRRSRLSKAIPFPSSHHYN